MSRRTPLLWGLAVLWWLCAPVAPAQAVTCTVAGGSVVFNAVDILSGAPTAAQTTITVTCVTTILDVTSLGLVGVCLGINAGSGGSSGTTRRMVSGANTLDFGLYQDAAYSVPWGMNGSPALGTARRLDVPVTIPVIIGTGGGSASVTLYAQLDGGQTTAPVGTYNATLSVEARYGLLTAPLIGGCAGILGLLPQSASGSFSVSAEIMKNCLVATQDMDFGSHGLLNADIDATGMVRVTCTGATGYTVGLDAGPYTAVTRRMLSGAYHVVYGLYQNAGRTVPWGSAGGQTVAGTGTGLQQNLTVFGRVPPQPTPPPGTYTDTVAVTVTY